MSYSHPQDNKERKANTICIQAHEKCDSLTIFYCPIPILVNEPKRSFFFLCYYYNITAAHIQSIMNDGDLFKQTSPTTSVL